MSPGDRAQVGDTVTFRRHHDRDAMTGEVKRAESSWLLVCASGFYSVPRSAVHKLVKPCVSPE